MAAFVEAQPLRIYIRVQVKCQLTVKGFSCSTINCEIKCHVQKVTHLYFSKGLLKWMHNSKDSRSTLPAAAAATGDLRWRWRTICDGGRVQLRPHLLGCGGGVLPSATEATTCGCFYQRRHVPAGAVYSVRDDSESSLKLQDGNISMENWRWTFLMVMLD